MQKYETSDCFSCLPVTGRCGARRQRVVGALTREARRPTTSTPDVLQRLFRQSDERRNSGGVLRVIEQQR